MPRTSILLMSIMLGSLLACSEERREDVSNAPEFKNVVGSIYEVVGAVDAYGIREHSKAETEYVTLIPPPGIGGLQVAFRIPIKIGSKITILKVFRTNRLIDPNMALEVQVGGTQMPVDVPVRIDLFRGNEGQGFVQLNPSIYRQQVRVDHVHQQ